MEKQLQPKLRFPEFSGDWTLKKIKDVAPLQRGFDLPSTQLILGDYPVVYSNGIQNYHNEFKVDGPGIVTGRSGTIGKIHYVKGKYWPHNTSLWVTDFKGNVPKYIYYFFLKLDFTKFNAGSTVPTLNRNDVHDLKRLIPSLPEQQKIADYLTTIDKKIELLTEKKTELSCYKKAMMQKLFAQEIRFKDENGIDYPEWEEKRLGDLLSIPAKIIDKTNNYDKLLTVKLHLKGVHVNDSTNGLKVGGTNYYIRKKGQFIYGKQNLFNGGFGIIPDELDGFLSSGDVPSLDINTAKLNGKYLLNYFSRENFYTKLESLSSGTGSKRIHEKTLFLIEINLPSLPEQQKIANFLSAIDDNIAKVEEQMKETQNFKKSMLQQLFV